MKKETTKEKVNIRNLKDPKDRKTKVFRCRITEQQEVQLKKNAKKLKQSPTDFFRESCCNKGSQSIENQRVLSTQAKKELTILKVQMSKVGNNLNQIARKLNITGEVETLELFSKEYLDSYKELIDKINKALEG